MTIKLSSHALRNTLQGSSAHGSLNSASPSSKLNTAELLSSTYVKSKDIKVFLEITVGE